MDLEYHKNKISFVDFAAMVRIEIEWELQIGI